MKNKKSQAFMDFLLTYGWAVLAGVIAIGILVYFGIFNPDRYVDKDKFDCENICQIHSLEFLGYDSLVTKNISARCYCFNSSTLEERDFYIAK